MFQKIKKKKLNGYYFIKSPLSKIKKLKKLQILTFNGIKTLFTILKKNILNNKVLKGKFLDNLLKRKTKIDIKIHENSWNVMIKFLNCNLKTIESTKNKSLFFSLRKTKHLFRINRSKLEKNNSHRNKITKFLIKNNKKMAKSK